MEIWKSVENWEFYEVSDLGRVRSLDRTIMTADGARRFSGRVLATNNSEGYRIVSLSVAGRRRCVAVHVLVARAFLGAPPMGTEVCHRDGDKKNPKLENLRYGTPSSNSMDRHEHGTVNAPRGEQHVAHRLTTEQVLEARRLQGLETQKSIALRFGVDRAHISAIQTKRRWKHVE